MATAILLRLLLGSAVVWHSSSGHELLEMTHTFDNGSLFWPNGQASFQMTILSLGETGNGYWYVARLLFGTSRQYYTFTTLWALSAKLKHGDIGAMVSGFNFVSGCIRVNK